MRKIITLALVAALITGCGSNEVESEVSVEDSGIIELSVLDSIGVELGDSNYVLGAVQKVDRDCFGNILVLDRSACCVRVYSPEGEFIQRISGRGSGPGELQNPLDMVALDNGTIAVVTPWSGGLHGFSPDGEWLGLLTPFTNNPPIGASAAGDSAYVSARIEVEPDDSGDIVCTTFVGRFELGEEPVVRYSEFSFPFDPQDLTYMLRNSVLAYALSSDSDGNVFMADLTSEEYFVRGYRADGELFLEIEKNVDPVPKTPEEMEEEELYMEAWLEGMGVNGVVISWEPEPYRDTISDIDADGTGRIWVRRGTELTPVFDVYDYQGELLFTASVPEAGDEGQFWVFNIDENGIIAYSSSPELFQQVFIIETP